MWLPGYRVELDAKAVPGVDNNLSGLTFDPDLNLLWAVTNGPNELLALSRDGDVERRYSLDGFHDVEAVSYAGNGQLVIAEERRQSLVIVDIPIDEYGKLSPDGVVCGRGRNPTLRLWPTIFSGKIDVFPGDRRSRLISSMTSVAPA